MARAARRGATPGVRVTTAALHPVCPLERTVGPLEETVGGLTPPGLTLDQSRARCRGAGLRLSCPPSRPLPGRVAVGGWSDRQVSMMARQAASRQRSFAPRGQAGRLTAKAA